MTRRLQQEREPSRRRFGTSLVCQCYCDEKALSSKFTPASSGLRLRRRLSRLLAPVGDVPPDDEHTTRTRDTPVYQFRVISSSLSFAWDFLGGPKGRQRNEIERNGFATRRNRHLKNRSKRTLDAVFGGQSGPRFEKEGHSERTRLEKTANDRLRNQLLNDNNRPHFAGKGNGASIRLSVHSVHPSSFFFSSLALVRESIIYRPITS